MLLSQSRAVVKLALFLKMFGAGQAEAGMSAGEVYLPMTRADIGGYINVAPEVVSRSLRDLVRRGAIAVRDRRHVTIIDPARLKAVSSDADMFGEYGAAGLREVAGAGRAYRRLVRCGLIWIRTNPSVFEDALADGGGHVVSTCGLD